MPERFATSYRPGDGGDEDDAQRQQPHAEGDDADGKPARFAVEQVLEGAGFFIQAVRREDDAPWEDDDQRAGQRNEQRDDTRNPHRAGQRQPKICGERVIGDR